MHLSPEIITSESPLELIPISSALQSNFSAAATDTKAPLLALIHTLHSLRLIFWAIILTSHLPIIFTQLPPLPIIFSSFISLLPTFNTPSSQTTGPVVILISLIDTSVPSMSSSDTLMSTVPPAGTLRVRLSEKKSFSNMSVVVPSSNSFNSNLPSQFVSPVATTSPF